MLAGLQPPFNPAWEESFRVCIKSVSATLGEKKSVKISTFANFGWRTTEGGRPFFMVEPSFARNYELDPPEFPELEFEFLDARKAALMHSNYLTKTEFAQDLQRIIHWLGEALQVVGQSIPFEKLGKLTVLEKRKVTFDFDVHFLIDLGITFAPQTARQEKTAPSFQARSACRSLSLCGTSKPLNQAQSKVLQDCYERGEQDRYEDIQQNEAETKQFFQKIGDMNQTAEDLAQTRLNRINSNKDYLLKQIEEKKERRHRESLSTEADSESMGIFPEFGAVCKDDSDLQRKEDGNLLKLVLDKQSLNLRKLREADVQMTRLADLTLLKQNADEMKQAADQTFRKKHEESTTLRESWDKEIHLKRLTQCLTHRSSSLDWQRKSHGLLDGLPATKEASTKFPARTTMQPRLGKNAGLFSTKGCKTTL